ncbi:hypothetical protein CHUAL_003950 [Chamberlinius hualienensis]
MFYCDYAYSLLWVMLVIIGIDVKNVTGGINHSLLRHVILTATVFYNCLMIFLHMSIFTIHLCFFNQVVTIVELSFLVYTIVQNTQVMVMYGIFIFRRNKMSQLLLKLNSACKEIMGVEVKVYYKTKRFLRLCLATIVLATIAFYACAMTDDAYDSQRPGLMDVEVLLKETSIFSNDSIVGQWYQTVEFSVLCLGLGSAIVCHFTFLVYYIVTAKLILTIFAHFKLNLVNWDNITSVKHHRQLCEIVELFENIFCEIIAIWNFFETFTIILIMRAMELEQIYSSWFIDKEAVIFLANVTVSFITKTTLAAGINNEVKSSLIAIHETLTGVSDDYSSEDISSVADFYICSIQVDPPTLTGWRLYVISNGLLLQVIAYVLTYVLVLYSIQDNLEYQK